MNERDLVKGQTAMKEANRCVGGIPEPGAKCQLRVVANPHLNTRAWEERLPF